ncbi:MAG: glycosyltransferase family 2 protein [Syntrophotaleaceae bacterium]
MQWSVVIPTYNYGRFIERCLNSVLSQPGDSYEIIVVDDGSKDDTGERIAALAKAVPAGRLRYFYQANQGPSAARNMGISQAAGEFIWFLDSDDRLTADAFGHMQRAVELNVRGELFFGGYRSVAEDGTGTDKLPGDLGSNRTENFRRYLLKSLKTVTTGAVAVRKKALGDLRFPQGIHSNEDIVLFGHLVARCEAVAVPKVVVEKIRHPASLRGNLTRIEETGLRSVDCLFDVNVLTEEQMQFRSLYFGNRCLELFRAHYLHENYSQARSYYREALKCCPKYLFKSSYLLKFLCSFLK